MTLRNDGSDSVSTLIFTLSEFKEGNWGDFYAKHENERLDYKRFSKSSSSEVGCEIQLHESISSGDTYKVTFLYDLVQAIVPVPEKIGETGKQYLKFSGNQYYYSPYKTEKVSTKLSLGYGAKGITVQPTGSHVKVSKTEVSIGPFETIASSTFEHYFVRFQADRGLLVAKSALKEFYVSHWGNIRVKEEYRLENRGAKHVGRWSRVDFLRDPKHSPTSIADVWANLPKDATNVVYRDMIGNITTSRLRKPTKKGRSVRLVFRYPLLGGWKNYFWFTYDIMLKNFVNSKGSSHVMKVPFTSSFDSDVPCESMVVKVLLPEGATNVQIMTPDSAGFVTHQSSIRTTLNYFGRKVVTLERDHMRSRSPHGTVLYISYDYSTFQMFQSPIIIISTIFAFFVAIVLFSRLDFTFSKTSTPEELETKRRKLVIKLDGYNEEIYHLHSKFRDLIRASQSSEDFTRTASDRLNLDASIRNAESSMSSLLLELCSEGIITTTQKDGVTKRYEMQRNADTQLVRKAKLLVEGKLAAYDYEAELKSKILPLAETAAADLDDFVTSVAESL